MTNRNPDDVVRAITAANYVQAHVWEQALREAGIECEVVGDYLTASVGGIPGLPAEIWVHKDDLARARTVLEEVEAAPEDYEPTEDAEPAAEEDEGQPEE